MYYLIIFLTRIALFPLYRIRVYGWRKFYQKGAILAANHASYMDPPTIAAACPGQIHFLAGDYLFKNPIFGWFIRKLNAHPVQRGQPDIKAIKLVCNLVNEGKKVLIFPEGTRSGDGQLQPFKNGLGFIFCKTQSAVIPTYIHGSYDVWSSARSFPKLWGKMSVVFGSPLLWEEFEHLGNKEAQMAVSNKLRERIADLKRWFEEGAKGNPP